METPDTWSDNSADNSSTVLFKVNEWDDEYWDVAKRLQDTISDAHISSLWRIQNKALWFYFSLHKQRLAFHGVDANEAAVWHGTRDVEPSVIFNDKQDGFMMQCANNGMCGRGIYFAEKSIYSDDYAFQPSKQSKSCMAASGRPTAHSDEREMFLAKLLVGNGIHMAPNNGLTAPPIDSQTQMRYNTVTGYTGGSRVYIVYENGRAYPEYLVRYYRKPQRDLNRTRYGSKQEARQCQYVAVSGTSSIGIWEFMDTNGWKPYADSDQRTLEADYQSYVSSGSSDAKMVDIRTSEWAYQVNLKTMVQTNVGHSNRTQRLVQRRGTGMLTTDEGSAIWEFMDSNTWKPYGPPHQRKLEAAYTIYVRDGSGAATLVDIRTSEWAYQVDLVTLVQTNVQHGSRTQRRVQRRATPSAAATPSTENGVAVWEFMDDHGWKAFADCHQSTIEAAYKSVVNDGKTVAKVVDIRTSLWAYQVDLETMVQTNMEHGGRTQRRVQRRLVLPVVAPATANGGAIWEYMDKMKWKPYSYAHQNKLEPAYQSFLSQGNGMANLVDIRTSEWAYQVNLATMVQTNVDHGSRTQRRVQRRVDSPGASA